MKKRSAILLALLLSVSMISPTLTYMQVYAEDSVNNVIVESEEPINISGTGEVETQPEQSGDNSRKIKKLVRMQVKVRMRAQLRAMN